MKFCYLYHCFIYYFYYLLLDLFYLLALEYSDSLVLLEGPLPWYNNNCLFNIIFILLNNMSHLLLKVKKLLDWPDRLKIHFERLYWSQMKLLRRLMCKIALLSVLSPIVFKSYFFWCGGGGVRTIKRASTI